MGTEHEGSQTDPPVTLEVVESRPVDAARQIIHDLVTGHEELRREPMSLVLDQLRPRFGIGVEDQMPEFMSGVEPAPRLVVLGWGEEHERTPARVRGERIYGRVGV